jgi:hypothetical protein
MRASRRIGFITLVLTTILCGIALARYGALDFARLGSRFALGDPNGSSGYDGQFAYYIARDGANATPFLDGATLRYQRILYPVAARTLAFGSANLVPYTLVVVNIAAHTASVALCAYLIALRKQSAWWAISLAIWLGALHAVRLDLNEPLCIALALGGVVAYTHEHYRLTAFLLILSTLTKEIGLVFAAALAIHAFLNGRRGWSILIFAAPVLAFLAWWGVLYFTFDTLPTRYPAARNLRLIPFNGFFAEESPAEMIMLAIWLAIPALILFIAAVWRVLRSRRLSLGSALMLAGAAWVMFMPDVSWVDPVAAYRVGMPMVVCGLIFLAEHHSRWLKWTGALWGISVIVALITPGMWI